MSIAVAAKPAGLLEPYTVTFRADGVHTRSDRAEGLFRWTALAFLRRTRNYLLIGVTPCAAVIVPLRMFTTPQESQAFWLVACELSRAPDERKQR